MANETDHIWLQQLSCGEAKAYRVLFDRYYTLLGVFAYRYLNDKQLAEDVVHDVLLELVQDKGRFLTIHALKTFLYSAVRNRCVDLLRHHKVQARYAGRMLAENEEFFYENQILEAEVYALLRKAISELPGQTRTVYDLVLQGYNNGEIADKMGLTEDAVKAHRKRGKKILKDKLKYLMAVSLLLKVFLS